MKRKVKLKSSDNDKGKTNINQIILYDWRLMNMNIAVIFAGGVGKRMGPTDKPKQFIEIYDKPIIIHTLEIFENNKNIDAIIVACKEEWIQYLEDLLLTYNIKKVVKVVPGGETGQMSIFNGIKCAKEIYDENSIVLIHDGVRPFIESELIDTNIENVKKKGSAISSVYSTETEVLIDNDNNIKSVIKRKESLIAKAPQSFFLKDIYNVHIQAQKDGITDSIDSCTLMSDYGKPLSIVLTDYDNIKITTAKDIALAESIYKRRNNL